jgi:hypothetical protein
MNRAPEGGKTVLLGARGTDQQERGAAILFDFLITE